MDEPKLPAALAISWGRSAAGTRGPRAELSAGAIVAAAIELADADGLGALSMSAIAAHLGFTTMSLYRHVPSKDDLLLLVQDACVGDPPADTSGTWRQRLGRWARLLVERYREHPWALDIPIAGPPAMAGQTAWLEYALAATARTNLTPPERLSVVLLLSSYCRSWAQLGRDLDTAGADTGEAGAGEYTALLRALIDPGRFPVLTEALDAGLFDDGQDELQFGLDRILDGVAAHMRRRARLSAGAPTPRR